MGSFSWQQGNLYPSMMLLSIARDAQNSPSPEAVVASHLCFLPVQIAVYIWYFTFPSRENLIFHWVLPQSSNLDETGQYVARLQQAVLNGYCLRQYQSISRLMCRYGVLLIITILAIVLWPARGLLLNSTQKFIAMLMNIRSSSGLKAKDEDAEWEMVWDAEGGMHLINKGPKTPAVPIGSSKTSAKR